MSETSPKLRAELEGIPTYKPGRPAAADGPVAYKLSSNENPYPPLPGVMESVAAAAASFNRYPDMACTGLMAELAERFAVPLSHLATGTGSVGVAQQLVQATSGPGDEVVYAWRSFEAYPIITRISGATPVQVDAEACMWTSRAVAIRFDVGAREYRCWVWASAVESRGEVTPSLSETYAPRRDPW